MPAEFGALGYYVNILILFLQVIQFPFPLLLEIVELFKSIIYIAQVSSQTLLQGLLVEPLFKSGLSTVLYILTLRH